MIARRRRPVPDISEPINELSNSAQQHCYEEEHRPERGVEAVPWTGQDQTHKSPATGKQCKTVRTILHNGMRNVVRIDGTATR